MKDTFSYMYLLVIIMTCFILMIIFSLSSEYIPKAIASQNNYTTPLNKSNFNSSLQAFDISSGVYDEMFTAEKSGILFQDFVARIIHSAKTHPENETLQREYRLIQNELRFDYSDFPDICNIEDKKNFDKTMSDVCNQKIAFIYPICQVDPTIHKEACDPANKYITNYLKYFLPSIQSNTASKLGYVVLNSAFDVPPPPMPITVPSKPST